METMNAQEARMKTLKHYEKSSYDFIPMRDIRNEIKHAANEGCFVAALSGTLHSASKTFLEKDGYVITNNPNGVIYISWK